MGKVFTCTCKHEFQDRTYGTGQRYHTPTNPAKAEKKFRCTVCGKTKDEQGNAK